MAKDKTDKSLKAFEKQFEGYKDINFVYDTPRQNQEFQATSGTDYFVFDAVANDGVSPAQDAVYGFEPGEDKIVIKNASYAFPWQEDDAVVVYNDEPGGSEGGVDSYVSIFDADGLRQSISNSDIIMI